MRKKIAIINVMVSLLLQIILIICGFIVPRLIIKHFGSNVNRVSFIYYPILGLYSSFRIWIWTCGKSSFIQTNSK